MAVPAPKSSSHRRVPRPIGSERPRRAQASQPVQLGEMNLRIDPSPGKRGPGKQGPVTQGPGKQDFGRPGNGKPIPTTQVESGPEQWLDLHAIDLIDRLTEWSDELSVREANLNAREASWERQARRLRMQFQETQWELDQLAASLNQERLDLIEQHQRLANTARQLAFASMSVKSI